MKLDFIIGGAMKSGTSSLHHILARDSRIFMPKGEVYFFDMDDVEQHSEIAKEGIETLFFEKHFQHHLSWYKSLFEKREKSQIAGERTTTYLPSLKAPSRIAEVFPGVKLIFMLREPVSRTYSQYWHMVKSGRAVYNFEETLRYNPKTLLQRSFYKRQVERYKEYFPKKNIKFVLFEEFIEDTQKKLNEISQFLGLKEGIDINKVEFHKNKAKVPRSLGLQLFSNYSFNNRGLGHRLASRVNLSARKYPPIDKKTRSFLQDLFAKENKGLEKLIDKDLEKYWGNSVNSK